MSKFQEILKDLRINANLTTEQLAKEIGYSKTIVYYWEIGKRIPNATALEAVSNYFSVSTDYLLGREDDFGIKKEAPNIRNQRQLSKSDLELLSLMDKLSPFARDAILIQVRALAAESEKDSVK